MYGLNLISICVFATLAAVVLGHPGHDVHAEAAKRAEFMKRVPPAKRGLGDCAGILQARGHDERNKARREKTIRQIRRRRGLDTGARYRQTRDLSQLLNVSHHSTLEGITTSTDPSQLFTSNNTCTLWTDVTQGPYYVTGEYIRRNIRENQAGVPVYLDIQVISTNTCAVVPNTYMDMWHCNATGVYSGVYASGNGNSVESNLNSTFLRGLQKTDKDGVVQFETIFPGHYSGRTNHIHLMTHPANETTVYRNGTISGIYATHASHVGQLFFDQSLIEEVQNTSPYNTNTQSQTLNEDDSILAQEAEDIDPFVEYVLLGDDLSDGIFAWISVAINPTEDDEISPAAYYTEDGGESNSNSGTGSGFGGGSPPGNSTAFPSGVPSPSSTPLTVDRRWRH